MKPRLIITCLLATSLVGCTTAEEPMEESVIESSESVVSEESVIEEELDTALTVIAEGLMIPWSIEKHGDIFYITEREGHIVEIENDIVVRQEVQLNETLSIAAEAGLMGFVLAPEFEETKQAFAYYTYEGETGPTNRIVILKLDDGVWEEEQVLLDNIPSGSFHHGGRLKIGPDGKLYATTGDATSPDLAQNLDSLAGKILRMNQDGTIPEDNPFSNSYIYSYGHRNPQGMVWLADGTMYASEHGNSANDEINRINPGENYGWPFIEGEEEQIEMVSPLFTSGFYETWAPSGMTTDEKRLYVAGLRGNAVFVFDLEREDAAAHLTEFGRIRDVFVEDGFLYFITNNRDGRGMPSTADDQLYRIGLNELD
ncbi:PQQ-dependent sugar dehydrogenase [Jeotgalibaca sp. A127]|uniref:PQQ-dependent sugar dehydrogenase n=1 Tax=Jeotgalibaca sp. A127 TaxID=3457324 RepID=UPI003FD487B5